MTERDVDFFALLCNQCPEVTPVWTQYFTEKGRRHILTLSYLEELELPHQVSAAWLWGCVGEEDRKHYHFFEVWTRTVRGLPLEAVLVLCTDRGPVKLVVRWTKNRFLPSAQEVARSHEFARQWKAVRRYAPGHFLGTIVPAVALSLVAYFWVPSLETHSFLPSWVISVMVKFGAYFWCVYIPIALLYFCSLCARSAQEVERKGPAYCPTG